MPRRRIGLRGRVVASFLVLLVTAEAASLLILHQVGTARLEDRAARHLTEAADDLRTWLDGLPVAPGEPGGPALAAVLEDYIRARPARDDEAYLAIVGGRPTAASAGAPTPLAELPEVPGWSGVTETGTGTTGTPAGEMRWLAVPVVAGGRTLGVLVAGEFLAAEQDALAGTVTTVAAVTVLVLVGASLLAWGAAGRALEPLHRLADGVRSVEDGRDLSTRLDIDRDDEVGVVASAVDGMLDRLADAFESQQRFLDDAGHELRTPLTIVRGHLELLDDDPGRRAAELALVLDELDRMDRMVRDLRVVARSGRPDFLALDDVDLAELVDTIATKATALADRRWNVVVPSPSGPVRLDPHRVTEAVLNLVDNAIEATTVDDVVEIGGRLDGAVELWVRDSGPGLDPAAAAGLFARENRDVPRRPGGTGLGLPIVAAIATAHGGEALVDTAPGAGSTFTLRLPLSAGGRR